MGFLLKDKLKRRTFSISVSICMGYSLKYFYIKCVTIKYKKYQLKMEQFRINYKIKHSC